MKRHIWFPIIILSLLLSSLSPIWETPLAFAQEPSAAATTKLLVNNKTGKTVDLNLQGQATYKLTIKPGKETFPVQPGRYQYTYKACGKKVNGALVVPELGFVLTLPGCSSQTKPAETVAIVIHNETHAQVHLQLRGPAQYDFYIDPGKKTVVVVKGKYDYTAWGCGSTLTGTLKFMKYRELWLYCYRKWR